MAGWLARERCSAQPRLWEVTQMHDGRFPVELVSGVPVVAAPEEIDITNAPELRSALLVAAADRPGTLVVDMTPGFGTTGQRR